MKQRLGHLRSQQSLERWESRTDTPLLALALAFLAVLLLPLLASLTPGQRTTLSFVSAVIWARFAMDYGVRLYLASGRWHFVRSHPLDLIVLALPMLRPLRPRRSSD